MRCLCYHTCHGRSSWLLLVVQCEDKLSGGGWSWDGHGLLAPILDQFVMLRMEVFKTGLDKALAVI